MNPSKFLIIGFLLLENVFYIKKKLNKHYAKSISSKGDNGVKVIHTKYVASGEGSVLGPVIEESMIRRCAPAQVVSNNVSC